MVGFKQLALILGAILPTWSLPVNDKRDAIPGKYIVTLKPGAEVNSHLAWVNDVHSRSITRRELHTGVGKTFGIHSFRGYSGAFDDETVARIRRNKQVCTFEPFKSLQKLMQRRLLLLSLIWSGI